MFKKSVLLGGLLLMGAAPVFAQPAATPDHTDMLQKRIEWLARSRETCEQALANVWMQAEKAQAALRAAKPTEQPEKHDETTDR